MTHNGVGAPYNKDLTDRWTITVCVGFNLLVLSLIDYRGTISIQETYSKGHALKKKIQMGNNGIFFKGIGMCLITSKNVKDIRAHKQGSQEVK